MGGGISAIICCLLCLWSVWVQVYSQDYVNVAKGKSYGQSSVYSGQAGPSSMAANGNTSGIYPANCIHTGNDDGFPWWEVDLGRTYPVHNISAWARAFFVYRLFPFTITVDGEECVSVNSERIQNGDRRQVNVSCSALMYGRVVRFTRSSLGTRDQFLNLCELQIWVPSEIAECPAGLHGAQCTLNCSQHCGKGPGRNFCYRSNAYCFDGCVEGWYGDQCSTPCSEGCQGVTCDRHTGHCEGCVEGRYGDQCSTPCSEGCQGSMCVQRTGECSPCRGGFTGSQCADCVSGQYGDQCSTPCSEGCQGITCDRQTGQCSPCKDGFTGSQCAECVPGRYGAQCSSSCPEGCEGSTCHRQTGQCQSCAPGYTGTHCSECPDGYYGEGCNQTCGYCHTIRDCRHDTGLCVGECAQGFTGPRCTEYIEGADASTDDAAIIGSVVGAGLFIGLCVIILGVIIWILRSRGRSSQILKDSNQNRELERNPSTSTSTYEPLETPGPTGAAVNQAAHPPGRQGGGGGGGGGGELPIGEEDGRPSVTSDLSDVEVHVPRNIYDKPAVLYQNTGEMHIYS